MQLNYTGNYIITGYLGTVKWSDTLGQPIASYTAGVSSLEAVETIILNDKLYIAGKAYIGSGYEGYLLRISDSLLTGIREESLPNNKIYPNPICTGSKLHFSIPAEKLKSVTLQDVHGNLFISEMFIHLETPSFVEIPKSLPAGTYIITFLEARTKSMYRLIVLN